MALRQLYNLSTSSLNPSGMTSLLPGGAGVQTSGSSTTPGISAPYIEQFQMQVLDVTAPTLITGQSSTAAATPAVAGKLLVWDPFNSAFGSKWKLNTVKEQAIGRGQYGIVTAAGQASEAGQTTSSVSGNVATTGTLATVVVEGPVQAYVQGTVGGVTISTGMALAADGAGNLTYAGASPAAGTVLGTYAGAGVASTVSIPVLSNVYIGGY